MKSSSNDCDSIEGFWFKIGQFHISFCCIQFLEIENENTEKFLSILRGHSMHNDFKMLIKIKVLTFSSLVTVS